LKKSEGNQGRISALYVWNGLSIFLGSSFHTDPHRHETLQLVFDLEKEFSLKDQSNDWQNYSSALIKAGYVHQLNSNDSIQLFLYLDNDSVYAQKLTDKYLSDDGICDLKNSDLRKLSANFFKRFLVLEGCDELFKECLTIINHLVDFDSVIKKDERVDKAISFITKTKKRKLKVKDIAEHVHLSESRLRHLFKQQVGQPIQNFMLWMKVISSLNQVLKGNRLTETAYDVGFWDASHMNRSYQELLGVAPSTIKKYEKELKTISCGNTNFYTFKTEVLKDWNTNEPYKTFEI